MIRSDDSVNEFDIAYELLIIHSHLRLLADVAIDGDDQHIKTSAFSCVMIDLSERLDFIHSKIS